MKRPMTIATILIVLLMWMTVSIQAQTEQTWIVSTDGDYSTIEEALLVATDGDTIEVYGGTHAPFIVEKSVRLIGVNNPVVDGEGEGTVVIITADDVYMSGFTIRNSGTNNSHEDSGLVIQADRVTAENNTLDNVLFGIYFADSEDGVARNNIVRGYDFDLARRGDGMRVWFSSNVLLENNYVSITRDILIWYADDITITGNTFTDARYGLHFMYSDNAWVEHNHFTYNSVGAYLMYSTGLRVINNDLSYNRGPSGYGIALKDMDDAILRDNWIIGNRAGLYLDNSPALYEGVNEYTGNVFAYNDIGIAQLPNVERNQFTGNIFLDNTQQVSVRGRGTLQGNIWTVDSQGNYWSDYAGYDAENDGIGDMAYRSEDLFDTLTDEQPNLRFFLYSPASLAIDLAASAFPSLRPEPRLVDDAPMTDYTFPDDSILLESDTPPNNPIPYLLLIAIGCSPLLTQIRFQHGRVQS